MTKQVKVGDKIEVTVTLEFEGTIRNHAVLIENQHIPTQNNVGKSEITLDGDPIQISGNFTGVPGSKIKKFEVVINDKLGYSLTETKLKFNQVNVDVPIPYSAFDLTSI